MTTSQLPITSGGHSTTAIAYLPEPDEADALIVLAHGAGAGQRHPFMTAVASGLAARGLAVVTFDFPYMAAGRRVPDRPPVLEACFEAVLAAARQQQPMRRRLFAGGKSMGGRMATHLASRDEGTLAGVVALGYPLHPPGRPEQRRDSHLPAITCPVLIVQGERDTFGTPAELEPVVAAMQARVTLHVVPGGDHSLATKGRKSGDALAGVLDTVARWIAEVAGAPAA